MGYTYLVTPCPHCFEDIIIYEKDINCGIFTHGVLKDTGIQISPHISSQEAQKLIQDDKIYGCGKSFKLEKNKNDGKFRVLQI